MDKSSLSANEEKIVDFWQKNKIFQKSVDMRKDAPIFSFFDGPPFATGLPHYGHILAGTIKDVVPRYKTMKGFYVPRRFGWDCHGIPVENEIETAEQLKSKEAIKEYGIARFNEKCRSIVLKYAKQWNSTIKRLGRFVDFDDAYRTMDRSFMESVWWVFGAIYKKGLIYKGFKVMPYSPKLGTALSNFEANLNYKEVADPAIVVKFPIDDKKFNNCSFLAWTTTPWTLLSNQALTLHKELSYVQLFDEKTDQYYILCEAQVATYFKADFKIVKTFKGRDLAGVKYHPPFNFCKGVFQTLLGEHVTATSGTGIVHTSPAFGEDDFYVCKKHEIKPFCPVDEHGFFTVDVAEFAGVFIKDADKSIIKELKAKKLLFNKTTIRHRYPFCWRSDTPLIYKVIDSWFVAVEKIKDELIANNETIHWVPAHIKHGRFGKWLQNARDWSISRDRFWGTPIPIWQNDKGDSIIVSSVSELEKLTGKKIDDIHRHFIDDLVIEKDGEQYRRIFAVFDCWFESGSMPYGQNHYPFNNRALTEQNMPADFIAEGLDQTRGWFYTLNVLSTILFKKAAFKNVIVNGIVLAEDGNKMSKRLKNYPEPLNVVDKYGADAVRLYLLKSPLMYADDLAFSEEGVAVTMRQVILPLWNALKFFTTYAKIYSWQPQSLEKKLSSLPNSLDRWIVSKLQTLIYRVEQAMDSYELNAAIPPIIQFITELTNWYIRRSRARFWGDDDLIDRDNAFCALYFVLLNFSKVLAPFAPFISDIIYQKIKDQDGPLSVHLCNFPQYNSALNIKQLEEEIRIAQLVVRLGHALRKDSKVKVRQPLAKMHIATNDDKQIAYLKAQRSIILDELNIKELVFHKDEKAFVHYSLKPNFKVLGKKIGGKIKFVGSYLQRLASNAIADFMRDGYLAIDHPEGQLKITKEDLIIQRTTKKDLLASNDEGITVAIDIDLTAELIFEGLARELVNKINSLRKELDFEISDRISIHITADDTIKSCFEKYGDYIMAETLTVDLKFSDSGEHVYDINGHEVKLALTKCITHSDNR